MTREQKKDAVARAALDHVEPGMVVGVGTGTTAERFVDALAGLRGRIAGAVPSSRATEARLRERGIRIVELPEVDELPLYVDGADEALRDGRLIKGGGGALTREKILAAASRRFVCIVDDAKLVERLGAFPLPVEVLPLARRFVARRLAELGGRAVPREGFVTDNGNVILDVHGLQLGEPEALESEIDSIAGVVASGLFCRRPADLLLVGDDDGVRRLGDGGDGVKS
jgi:ribose 5-phosphate isomerase A